VGHWVGVLAIVAALSARGVAAQPPTSWDVFRARGHTREIDFLVSEGTWMSLDVSPDGRWIVFDLLAHIYRVPIGGGEAQCLTQESGIATNYHPRYSPDGRSIARRIVASSSSLWTILLGRTSRAHE
jgi:hypothetical protein